MIHISNKSYRDKNKTLPRRGSIVRNLLIIQYREKKFETENFIVENDYQNWFIGGAARMAKGRDQTPAKVNKNNKYWR